MSDLISRQEAYEALTEYYHHRTERQHKALWKALSGVTPRESDDRKMLSDMCKEYERKLHELMGDEAFAAYMKSEAIKLFLKDVQSMPDGDFKDFCLENFDRITE